MRARAPKAAAPPSVPTTMPTMLLVALDVTIVLVVASAVSIGIQHQSFPLPFAAVLSRQPEVLWLPSNQASAGQ
jgi:hypothetical protein